MHGRPEQLLEQATERFELGDYHGAIHLVDELIEAGRAYADAHHLRGLAYQMLGRPQMALAEFDQALAKNPHYVEALIHRGIVLAELGRSEDAEAAFARARDAGGQERQGIAGHDAAKLANLHARLGEAYYEAGALGRAIDQYHAALELGPAFHDLRYRRGRLLLEAGRSLEARDEFEYLVDARPGWPRAQAALGLACYVAGDAATARGIWEALAREHPDDPRARAYLAMLDRGAA